jgi:hypothetical protein
MSTTFEMDSQWIQCTDIAKDFIVDCSGRLEIVSFVIEKFVFIRCPYDWSVGIAGAGGLHICNISRAAAGG